MAKALNKKGIVSPTGCSWAPASVKAIRIFPFYRGKLCVGARHRDRRRRDPEEGEGARRQHESNNHPDLIAWDDATVKKIDRQVEL